MTENNNKKIVLASYLAKAGLASRRKCQAYIRSGDVSINGIPVTELSTVVDLFAYNVTYKGIPQIIQEKRYYLLHKPKGYICSANDKYADQLVYDLIKPSIDERLFSVGRLDKDSEGLIILTNDGDLTNRLTHPRFEIKKVYDVDVQGSVGQNDMFTLKKGIMESGEILKAHSAIILKKNSKRAVIRITVCEGKKREIKRMCRFLGLRVKRLIRIAFGPLKLGEFKPGLFRELTDEEVNQLTRISHKVSS